MNRTRRVLDAALTCIARVGLAKTTLDDVAREAGCARATVYRMLPGQAARCSPRSSNARPAGSAPTSSRRGRGRRHARRRGRRRHHHRRARLQAHPALAFVAAYEPELVAPAPRVRARERVPAARPPARRARVRAFLPDRRATRLGEWIARITLSYLCCPSEHVDVSTPAQVRALVDDFVLPGFTRADADRKFLEGSSQ